MSSVVCRLCRHVVDDVTIALLRTSKERKRDVTSDVKYMTPIHLQLFSDQRRSGVSSWNRQKQDEYQSFVHKGETVDILTESRLKAKCMVGKCQEKKKKNLKERKS